MILGGIYMLNNNNKNNISSNLSSSKNIDNKKDFLDTNIYLEDIVDTEKTQKYHYLKKKQKKLIHDQLKSSQKYEKEIINITSHLNKKIQNTYKFFLDKYFLSVLPILDSIESSLRELDSLKSEIFLKVFIKLEEINKLFLSIFSDFGVTVINNINIPFNPEIHQAMSIDFSGKYMNNYITNIIQKGYLLNNRLLRPAMVSVSQSKI